jgi:hypothetical protein
MKPVMSIDSDGDTVWQLDGEYHREDGPAVIWQGGSKEWCLHGALHRTDGPAGEYADGELCWCLYGTGMAFEEWLRQTTGLTDEEKVMMKLTYG